MTDLKFRDDRASSLPPGAWKKISAESAFKGRSLAVYRVERFSVSGSYKAQGKIDGSTLLRSETTVEPDGTGGGFTRFRVNHLSKPETANYWVRLKASSEEIDDGLVELREAIGVQKQYLVEMRFYEAEKLLVLFSAREVVKEIASELQRAGALKMKPFEFDLWAINEDPRKEDIFNVWSHGTDQITSKGFFGHEVLNSAELKGERLTSIRAQFKVEDETLVLYISSDGRITYIGAQLTNNDLMALFRKLEDHELKDEAQSTLPSV